MLAVMMMEMMTMITLPDDGKDDDDPFYTCNRIFQMMEIHTGSRISNMEYGLRCSLNFDELFK